MTLLSQYQLPPSQLPVCKRVNFCSMVSVPSLGGMGHHMRTCNPQKWSWSQKPLLLPELRGLAEHTQHCCYTDFCNKMQA